MTEAFDSPTVLNVKYAFGLAGTLSCSFIIVRILFNIELNQFKRSVAPEVEKNLSELTLSSTNSEDDEYTNGNQSVINPSLSKDSIQKIKSSKSEDSFARKKRVHKETKFGIYFNVALLTFVNYLLMVYLPSGVAPSLIAMVFLTAILLRAQLVEDLRRKRFDRISAVFTLLIFMASFLSLCTYATIGHKEGGVYEGKARIVGYDVTNYNDGTKGGDMQSGAVRTDLEVEWGGQWGCPDTPEKQCHAYVSGALCEAKTNNRRRRSRTLKKDKKIQDANDVKEYYKEVKDEVDEYTEDLKEEVDEVAEEDGLYYVADLEGAEAVEEYYANATETEIDTEEKDIDNTVDSVEADLSNVKDTVLEGDDPDGSMASGVINETTTDLQALEDKIAELEKEVEVLEETNAEEEELTEIDQSNAEYYASEVIEVVDESTELAVENEELGEDVTYYANLADEEIETNNALVNANEDLQEETQELENEVDNTKQYYKQKEATTTEEETVNNNAYGSNGDGDDDFMYAFEDDFFEDEYWGYDWDSAWGDYACNDLFDTDLSDQTYDENEAPGNDVFPYVNIYGTCNSCKAFLVDYYSTAHFDKIREYQTHAVTYAVFGVVSILVTVALMIKEHVSPAQENQIDLLMSAGAYV